MLQGKLGIVKRFGSVAILDGQVGFDAFESDARQRVAKMALKISLERNEEIEKAYPNAWGAEVKVKLTNGKEFSVRLCV
jgi:2-methylcitrate dehydratase PrpD